MFLNLWWEVQLMFCIWSTHEEAVNTLTDTNVSGSMSEKMLPIVKCISHYFFKNQHICCYESRVYIIYGSHPSQPTSMQWWQVTASLAFQRLNRLPGRVALRSEVQTRAPDGRRLSEDESRTWRWWVLRRVEMKQGGLHIPPRPAAVCSSHPGTPAHTLRCGLELSQEHSEERLDERDWVYGANHRPTVCLLPSCSQLCYTHSRWCACTVCVCAVCLDSGDSQVPFIAQKEVLQSF